MKWRAFACLAALLLGGSSAARAQESGPQPKLFIAYPGKNWTVEIDSPGFIVQTQERKADGREYLLARNPGTEIILSVTLEQARGGAGAKTCPGYLQKRVSSLPPQLSPVDVHALELGDMAVIEYLVPSAQGISVQQKNVVACLARDDVYADIHLSKVKFQPSDESLFTDILNRVHTGDYLAVPADRASSVALSSGASSSEYFQEGSRHFIDHDYSGAIAPYQAALDLEKAHPRLSKNLWRVLVDNLGMAYGISGDLDHSEETYTYGISKDPDYPGFYYSMACVWAERNNLDNAMDYLQKAFARKANEIPGETMPDPRQDDSFQRFMSNERFRKFVDSLYSQN